MYPIRLLVPKTKCIVSAKWRCEKTPNYESNIYLWQQPYSALDGRNSLQLDQVNKPEYL